MFHAMKGTFVSAEEMSCEVLNTKHAKVAGAIVACRTYVKAAPDTSGSIQFAWVVDSELGTRVSNVFKSVSVVTSDCAAAIESFTAENSHKA